MMSHSSARRALLALTALAASTVIACNDSIFYSSPPSSNSTFALRLSLADGAVADTFDFANRIHIRIRAADSLIVDTMMAFTPAAETRIPLEVPDVNRNGRYQVDVELLRDTSVLVAGMANTTLGGVTTSVNVPMVRGTSLNAGPIVAHPWAFFIERAVVPGAPSGPFLGFRVQNVVTGQSYLATTAPGSNGAPAFAFQPAVQGDAVVFSADIPNIANRSIHRLNLTTGQFSVVRAIPQLQEGIAFDGQHVVFGTLRPSAAPFIAKGVYALNVATGAVTLLWSHPDQADGFVFMGPTHPGNSDVSGNNVAFIYRNNSAQTTSLILCDIPAAACRTLSTVGQGTVITSLSFDGNRLAYSVRNGLPPGFTELRLYNVTNGSEQLVHTAPTPANSPVILAGNRIAYTLIETDPGRISTCLAGANCTYAVVRDLTTGRESRVQFTQSLQRVTSFDGRLLGWLELRGGLSFPFVQSVP